MAFNFGGTSTPAFGSTPQKPTGFATAFGSPQATPAQATGFSFGQQRPAAGFGSAFGTTTTNAPPAFGASTSFAAGNTGAAPVFGSTFGTPASSAAPAFGTTFGAPQQNTSLFGQTAKPTNTLFGTAATPNSGLFGNTASAAPTLFGNTQTTQSAPGLFGGGSVTTPSIFGQSAAPASTVPSLFGGSSFSQTAATAAPSFGGSFFGAAQSSAPSLFGTNTFNTTNAGLGAFGAGAGTNFGANNSLFGAKPQQQLVAPQSRNQQAVASVYSIIVFNDERDDILKKWNMLQACWASGKGFYNSAQPPVEYTPQNPFYRFKAMGYNVIPEQDNSEGVVKIVFNKKIADLRNQQDVLKNGIGGILGNRPNLTVEILLIKALCETQTEVKICVSEKGVTGCSRKIPATELAAFLNQPTQKQQLANVGVTAMTPFVTPSKAELEEYLKNPPPGIDQQMWQAAIQDNPNPKKYIPVPINGFTDLRARMLNQEHQTGLHSAFLDKVKKDITVLKTRHTSTNAQIADLKQKFLEMQHRILRVLVKQESTRKVGIALQPDEELLRGRLEVMHSQLNMPKQFKGQINELLSHVKMIESSAKQTNLYQVNADAQDEMKQFLKLEQNGISQLINIVDTDLKSLQIITDGLKELVQRRHNV